MQPQIRTGLTYDAMFVVLDERQKAAIFRITEHKREALIKCQQQPSPLRSARHEQEPASVHRAAERGVKRRWKKVDVKRQ